MGFKKRAAQLIMDDLAIDLAATQRINMRINKNATTFGMSFSTVDSVEEDITDLIEPVDAFIENITEKNNNLMRDLYLHKDGYPVIMQDALSSMLQAYTGIKENLIQIKNTLNSAKNKEYSYWREDGRKMLQDQHNAFTLAIDNAIAVEKGNKDKIREVFNSFNRGNQHNQFGHWFVEHFVYIADLLEYQKDFKEYISDLSISVQKKFPREIATAPASSSSEPSSSQSATGSPQPSSSANPRIAYYSLVSDVKKWIDSIRSDPKKSEAARAFLASKEWKDMQSIQNDMKNNDYKPSQATAVVNSARAAWDKIK